MIRRKLGFVDNAQSVRPTFPPLPGNPRVILRSEHNISRKLIDPDALKVMKRLVHNGYRAFLVGGGVRDLLLGKAPKDYDVGTDARTEVVRSLFRNSRTIGRRFKINHVYFRGNNVIEVATFRGEGGEELTEGGLITSDNAYGDPETDAKRRDLTINGLFYDLNTFSIIDYVGGTDDLKNGIVRIIGDPERRIREDPVRMIRAVRHAARTNFEIEKRTYNAISKLGDLLVLCSQSRVSEEFIRELREGHALGSFDLLVETGLLSHLVPALAEAVQEDRGAVLDRLHGVLRRVDDVISRGRELPLGFILAGVIIGNITRRFVDNVSERGELVAAYLDCSPFAAEESEEGSEQGGAPRAGAKRRSYKLPLSELGRVLREVFSVVRIPRKDREHLERLLTLRAHLFVAWRRGEPLPALLANPYFEETLLLLDLVCHNGDARLCLSFWQQHIRGEEKSSSRGSKRRRGRRGGSRRRRSADEAVRR